jgi:hypothetical protein
MVHFSSTPIFLKTIGSMMMSMQRKESSMYYRRCWSMQHHVQVLMDFLKFIEGGRPFVNMPTITLLNMPPHEWWDLIVMDIHTFAPWLNILPQVFLTL